MPDLPELESVEASHRIVFFVASLMAGVVGFVLAPVFVYWNSLSGFRLPVILCSVLLVAPVVWLIQDACTSGYYWKTDSEGITEHTLFRRKRIQWSDVTRAETRKKSFLSSVHHIWGECGCISIIANGGMVSYSLLEASVWQHLRRVDKAGRMIIDSRPLSFWDTIPDAVLEPVEVNLPVPQDTYSWLFVYALFAGSAFVFTSDHHRAAWPWIGVATLAGAGLLIHFVRKQAPVRHYVLTPDHVEILGNSPHKLRWADVTGACGGPIGHYATGVRFRTNDDQVVVLTPTGSDPNAKRAKLALIRHLREAGQTVMIPKALRIQVKQPLALPAQLDLRFPAIFVWFMPALTTVSMGLVAVMPGPQARGVGDLVIAASGWLVGLAAARYRVYANHEGIRKVSIFGTRYLRWEDITSYGGGTVRPERGQSMRMKLKGHGKGACITIQPDLFLAHDWEILRAYIDSKLAHLLPPPEEQPVWLARPFGS